MIQLVQSTCSMRKHAKLGGLGACPPKKILKIECTETASDGASYKTRNRNGNETK